MKKIISLFKRDYENSGLVYDEIEPSAEWVVNGEGIATKKYDGTCCLIRDGILYRRYDAKNGKKPPHNFEPAQPNPDPITKHWPGWVPISKSKPNDKWHLEAFDRLENKVNGTYELCGPAIQSNPEGFDEHILINHATAEILYGVPVSFLELKEYLFKIYIEGIVWHHADGIRMVKIKKSDFGLERNTNE